MKYLLTLLLFVSCEDIPKTTQVVAIKADNVCQRYIVSKDGATLTVADENVFKLINVGDKVEGKWHSQLKIITDSTQTPKKELRNDHCN